MNSTNDPFSSTLPGLESPLIFDPEVNDPLEPTNIFFNSALPQDSPGGLFGDDALANSPFPSPLSAKVQQLQKEPNTLKTDAPLSVSPDSSLRDSSSESSDCHKRKSSSRSSRSGVLQADVIRSNGAEVMDWRRCESLIIEQEPDFSFSTSNIGGGEKYDFSNRAMESSFDFDSAASSPSPIIGVGGPRLAGHRHIAIPYRESPQSSAVLLPRSRPTRVQETSPFSNQFANHFRPPALQQQNSSPASSTEEYVDGAMLSRMEQLSWSHNNPAQNTYLSRNPLESLRSATTKPVISPPASGLHQNEAFFPPTLLIHPTPHKSRVETQIQIKLTFFPMPEGVTKLHLPPHTISKPKLLVKSPSCKEPDTLELSTTLVCTSAMQDPVKLQRALAAAAAAAAEVKSNSETIKAEGQRNPSGDAISTNQDDIQPLDGGPVKICTGCVIRERKRAARKKSKKPEEEALWAHDEARRIIVFNTSEIKEWLAPSAHDSGSDTLDAPSYTASGLHAGTFWKLPMEAKKIELPMRIACYCRHQNEKLGFQVIFTIKDYQDKLVAQAITNPIMITDDHKTHASPAAMPPSEPLFTDPSQLPGGGVFGREPLENYSPAPFRNAHSTTDLQNLQQSFPPPIAHQSMRPFAAPQNISQPVSATLTPRNLSRQASPSAQYGPVPKRRKGSSSGKIPDGLTMTRIQTTTGPNIPNLSRNSTTPSNPVSPAIISPFGSDSTVLSAMRGPFHSSRNSLQSPQVLTGSSTLSEQCNLASGNRSHSLENLTGTHPFFSAPNSSRASRAPSPMSNPQSANPLLPCYGPTPGSGTFSVPGSVHPQRAPVIHKLIPNEGTKAGGIEVTCLGSGFHQGLEVMFGDSLATTTTYWGETSLVCLLPPAIRAGTVAVTFKHQYEHQHQLARYASPSMPKNQVLFKYIDDNEQELLKHALLIVHQKMTGTIVDAGEIARSIINSVQANGNKGWTNNSTQGDHHRQISTLQACLSSRLDVEAAVLKCLDLIDLDDSSFPTNLNLSRPNGQSMLHLSASLGYVRLVAGLLARGANADLRDNNGMSPMHIAALHGHTQIVRRLRLAGGDPSLRSLLGFTPADMASSQSVWDVIQALQSHSRSRSAGASTASLPSRASSVASLQSLLGPPSTMASFNMEDSHLSDSENDESDSGERLPPTPAQIWARSRQNSTAAELRVGHEHGTAELSEPVRFLPSAAAMTAWRDQLATQIQHFQQSVNWTLPHIQIPTLPPMPNLPHYQAYPVVRHFSALVPQRNNRLNVALDGNTETKEGDYGWWEILTGTTPSPPAYDEIFPNKSKEDMDTKIAPPTPPATHANFGHKYAASSDMLQESPATSTPILTIDKRGMTAEEQEQLRMIHAKKMKRLKSDRNLFFVWIPLLVLVIMAMLKDRIPQIWYETQQMVLRTNRSYEQLVEMR